VNRPLAESEFMLMARRLDEARDEVECSHKAILVLMGEVARLQKAQSDCVKLGQFIGDKLDHAAELAYFIQTLHNIDRQAEILERRPGDMRPAEAIRFFVKKALAAVKDK